MGGRTLEQKYILLFYFAIVCLAASGWVVRHMVRAATVHHAAHITFCNFGEALDPLVLADWAPDVREYATQTPCWWAPTRWLLEGMLAGGLLVGALWILWYLWGGYVVAACRLALEARTNNKHASLLVPKKAKYRGR